MNKKGQFIPYSDEIHSIGELALLLGEQHAGSSQDIPVREDAFEVTIEEKIKRIAAHFREIMLVLGLDLDDESLAATPYRVASMYVKEAFSGLDPGNKPVVTLFENNFSYDQMLIEKDIRFHSYCEHHFVPIIGKAHVAYISSGKIIGLSKINRIVRYLASRPQVQERLTVQIAREMTAALHTPDVAVVVDACHLCVSARGVKDTESSTVTAWYGGRFKKEEIKCEFLSFIK